MDTSIQLLASNDHNLTYLDLSGNRIGVDGVHALVEALRHNTFLTHLDLSWTQLGNSDAQIFAQALQHNTCLTQLNLCHNQIGVIGTQALAEALQHNTGLTRLNLYGNQIGDTGAQVMAEILLGGIICSPEAPFSSSEGMLCVDFVPSHNTTLTELNLGENQIGNLGAIALAQTLLHNTGLIELNLSENQIGNAGGQALIEAVRHNTVLTRLDLHKNHIGDYMAYTGNRSLNEIREKLNQDHLQILLGIISPNSPICCASCDGQYILKKIIRFAKYDDCRIIFQKFDEFDC